MALIKPFSLSKAFVGLAAVLLLCALGGCFQSQKARPSTTARWEAQLGLGTAVVGSVHSKLDRKVADASPVCLKDRLAPDLLRQDVLRLEQEQGGTPVQGQWQGKDLSTFPSAQARFIQANANWIASNQIDLSSCTDLPCIIGRIYGSSGSDEAWKIYGFYLRAGYPLSLRDWVPGATESYAASPSRIEFPNATLAQHLFSPTELLGFWKLSYLLPDTYKSMSSIMRFHRIPQRKPPADPSHPDADWIHDPMASDWGPTTCADSWGSKNFGFIRLRRCLEEDNGNVLYEGDDTSHSSNGIHGQFYLTVNHEMTHSWDRAHGPDYSKDISDTDEWMGLSGWHIETVVTPRDKFLKDHKVADCVSGPQSDTCITHQWASDPAKDGFVRSYAGSSPKEDFAETAAWVRFRPDAVAKRSPAKAAWLAQKIFGGRTYDASGLNRFYEDTTVSAVAPTLLELVNSCLSDANSSGSGSGSSNSGGHLAIDRPVPQPILSCLEHGINTQMDTALAKLRGSEWEACGFLNTNEAKLRSQVLSRVSPDVSKIVGQNLDRAPVIRAASQLRAALIAQVDPREAYIHCLRQPAPQDCYQGSLRDAFDRLSQPFASVLGEMLLQEKTSFMGLYPYDQTAARTNLFYRQIFDGAAPAVGAAAEARWKSCLEREVNSLNADIPVLQPFSGGTHFVAAAILNCVNGAVYEDLKTARDAYISHFGLTVSDPDVQALIQNLLLPNYLEAIRAKEALAAASEDQDRAQRESGVLDVLGAELISNLSWMQSAGTVAAAAELCFPVAQTAFDSYFARVSASQQIPVRFAALADIRSTWSRDACARVIASPSVTQALEKSANRAWNGALNTLAGAVSQRARDRATDCIARFPHRNSYALATVKRNRRSCMTERNEWSMIEAQSLVDWDETPEGRAYSSRRVDAQVYLRDHRTQLQNAAITAMEAR